MNLNKTTISTITVVKPNYLDMHPGGLYDLNEDNSVELRVVKLHLLQHHIDMMINDICETGENRIHRHRETEHVADMLFDVYAPCIKLGVDIFNAEGRYYEETVIPLKQRILDVRAILQEALDNCEDGIEGGYLKALIQMANYVDVPHYRELYKMLEEYEHDYKKSLYWKRDVQL